MKTLQIVNFFLIIILFIGCNRFSNDFNINEIEINKNTRGVTYLYREKPITGLIYERNDSYILLKEYEFDNGMLSGFYREYYISGNLKLEKFYLNVKKFDLLKKFFLSFFLNFLP